MTMIKTAFVTGAGGFIGSHLVAALLRGGWRVKALVRYNSRSHWGWLEEHRSAKVESLEVILGDITDPFSVQEAMAGCEVVFHLAALIGIPYSYIAPASYVQTNITGTLNLLQAALACRVRRFIHTSTSEVYGTARYTPIDEAHPLQGQSPYSASKIAADKLVESFVRSRGLPTVVVRPFNTYGPRQSARAVIPSIVTQALNGKKIRLGSLHPVRDLTYVTDTTAGFIAAATARNAVGKVFNLGTGQAVSIRQLAEIIFKITGEKHPIMQDPKRVRPKASEVEKLISDNTLARKTLRWTPRVSLRQGLEQTVKWIRANRHLYRAEEYAR